MKRELKPGASFRLKDGTIYERQADGKLFKGNAKRRDPFAGEPIFEVSEADFKKDPSPWIPLREETEAVRQKRVIQEEAWHAARGTKPSEGLLKEIGTAPENKMVTAPGEPAPQEAEKRGPGRPPKMVVK